MIEMEDWGSIGGRLFGMGEDESVLFEASSPVLKSSRNKKNIGVCKKRCRWWDLKGW